MDKDDLPRPAPEIIEDGIPATDEISEEQLRTLGVSEGPIPPLDEPQAVEDWGTTTREERAGEPLGLRLAREEPEVFAADDEDVRQVFQPGAEFGADSEPDEVGDLDADWEDTLSAEEQAMRIEAEPPGLTYDEGPDYIEGE